MQENEKLAIAAHLYVLLRRATGRVTDVHWLIRDRAYAQEIIQLALAQTEPPELQRWARKLGAALELPPLPGAPVDALESGLLALTPPSGFGDSSMLDSRAMDSRVMDSRVMDSRVMDSRIDSRLDLDSRIGETRPSEPGKPGRYVGRLR